MKRLIYMGLVLGLLLTGCAAVKDGGGGEPERGGIVLTDDLGRELCVSQPERVAALIGSFADIWCLAGGKDQLVAAASDTWTQFDLGLSETVANLGGVKEIDLERLAAAKPDLVLASCNTAAQIEWLDTMEALGLTVAYFKVTNFEEYLRMLELCTQLTGCGENYVRYGTDIQAQIDEARQRADGSRPTVLYVRATASTCKVKNSRDSVLGEMLADLDCVNIADREGSALEDLSMEAILREDPDFIFAVIQGSDPSKGQAMLEKTLLHDPAWNGLTAVREGRFHVLDNKLYNLKPNARWGEAYEALAAIVYP